MAHKSLIEHWNFQSGLKLRYHSCLGLLKVLLNLTRLWCRALSSLQWILLRSQAAKLVIRALRDWLPEYQAGHSWPGQITRPEIGLWLLRSGLAARNSIRCQTRLWKSSLSGLTRLIRASSGLQGTVAQQALNCRRKESSTQLVRHQET